MADLDVEKNKNNSRNNSNNRDKNNRDNSRKWWIGLIIAVVVITILLMLLNDRTDYSMDDEPATETTAFVEPGFYSGPQLSPAYNIREEIRFM